MVKAYDLVQWFYIYKLLLKLDFDEILVDWITQCITTPTYKFNNNGDTIREVKPTRGLISWSK